MMASGGMALTIDNRAWEQAVSAKTHASETAAQQPANHETAGVGHSLFFGKDIYTIARGYAFRTNLSRRVISIRRDI
jgi:hypothetical protein